MLYDVLMFFLSLWFKVVFLFLLGCVSFQTIRDDLAMFWFYWKITMLCSPNVGEFLTWVLRETNCSYHNYIV